MMASSAIGLVLNHQRRRITCALSGRVIEALYRHGCTPSDSNVEGADKTVARKSEATSSLSIAFHQRYVPRSPPARQSQLTGKRARLATRGGRVIGSMAWRCAQVVSMTLHRLDCCAFLGLPAVARFAGLKPARRADRLPAPLAPSNVCDRTMVTWLGWRIIARSIAFASSRSYGERQRSSQHRHQPAALFQQVVPLWRSEAEVACSWRRALSSSSAARRGSSSLPVWRWRRFNLNRSAGFQPDAKARHQGWLRFTLVRMIDHFIDIEKRHQQTFEG